MTVAGLWQQAQGADDGWGCQALVSSTKVFQHTEVTDQKSVSKSEDFQNLGQTLRLTFDVLTFIHFHLIYFFVSASYHIACLEIMVAHFSKLMIVDKVLT